MTLRRSLIVVFVIFSLVAAPESQAAPAKEVRFAGRRWEVRDGEVGGPGPNRWDARNVRVDEKGALHLKIARRDGGWSCAEVTLLEPLGFGRYEFDVDGRIDRLDPNVVCGLFLYPTPDLGPDGTNEIDIEWARWGHKEYPIGNYTVWPVQSGAAQQSHTFPISLNGALSTHRWDWQRAAVSFESFRGLHATAAASLQKWTFRPPQPAESIASKPMPLHFNLWLFDGHAPLNAREAEIVIRAFRFIPLQSKRLTQLPRAIEQAATP